MPPSTPVSEEDRIGAYLDRQGEPTAAPPSAPAAPRVAASPLRPAAPTQAAPVRGARSSSEEERIRAYLSKQESADFTETPKDEPTSASGRILKGVGRGAVTATTIPAKMAGAYIDLENRAESAILDPLWRSLGLAPRRTLSDLVTGSAPKSVTGGVALRAPAEMVERAYERVAPVTPAKNWKETATDIGSEIAGGVLAGGLVGAGRAVPRLLGRGGAKLATEGPLALRPQVAEAVRELAESVEGQPLRTGGYRIETVPTPPRPAGTQQVLSEAERILTGGEQLKRGTQRTLEAAQDLQTGRGQLDLGEVGRRRAAFRNEGVRTDPGPAPAEYRIIEESGRPVPHNEPLAPPNAPPTTSSHAPDYSTGAPSAAEFSKDLFPTSKQTPLSPPPLPGEGLADTPPGKWRAMFQDETGHLDIGKAWTEMRALASKGLRRGKDALPQELAVLRARPESKVITEVERLNVGLGDRMDQDIVKQPWFKALRQLTPDTLNQLEAQAVREWEAGGRTPQALQQAIAKWPKELQEYVQYRNTALRGEQAARGYLGLDPIPETPGPYLPRMTDAEARDVARAGGQLGVGRSLQTTVKGAQHGREFATQLEGEAAQVAYIDRRAAITMREWNSLKLRHTAQLIRNLEGETLFRTKDAAKLASPTGQAFAIEGLPGAQRWWTPTREEAVFLAQNLKDTGTSGALQTLKHYGDALFRNPNLFNPSPHVTKNMWIKYLLASGHKAPRLIQDGIEFTRRSDPKMMALFEEYMPHAKNTTGAFGALQEALPHEGIAGAGYRLTKAAGLINKPSSTFIFKYADPAMRYSLFKNYISKGMSPQEAANHTWIDLVRYSTRSQLTDMWKAWPMNFFVPWRFGSVATLVKQSMYHPIRTAMIIGGVDYLREIRYRKTGRWTHLPWDYAEGPIALGIDEPSKIPSQVVATAAFGPSGEFAARQLGQLLIDVGKLDPGALAGDLGKTLWGLSQLSDAATQGMKAWGEGDLMALADGLAGIILGERSALNYRPHRLASNLPEWLPGLEKSVKVDMAERLQEQAQLKRDRQAAKTKSRKRKTIEQRVEGY